MTSMRTRWFNITTAGVAGNDVPYFRFFFDTTRFVDIYRYNSNGQLWLRVTSSTGFTYTEAGVKGSITHERLAPRDHACDCQRRRVHGGGRLDGNTVVLQQQSPDHRHHRVGSASWAPSTCGRWAISTLMTSSLRPIRRRCYRKGAPPGRTSTATAKQTSPQRQRSVLDVHRCDGNGG